MTGPSVCHNLSLILEDSHGGRKSVGGNCSVCLVFVCDWGLVGGDGWGDQEPKLCP